MHILVLDDQRSARRILCSLVRSHPGVEASEAADLEAAREILRTTPIDLAFVDLRLSATDSGNRDGLVFLQDLKEQASIPAVVVSGYGDMPEIRAAMRRGAQDFLLKDELCEEIVAPIIESYRSRHDLETEVRTLRSRVRNAEVPGIIGTSPAITRLRQQIRRVAVSDRPVLVLGPSGAGKELVVRALQALGPSPDAPFIDINCSALPEHLIEAQLFGYEKGAFTGAQKDTEGYLSAVGCGLLFLDEIAELPLALQAKLLRALETRRFRMLGSMKDREFRGRVVAATHADLEERIGRREFREDLFHRLDVLRLQVPALSERREDIPALVAHFAQQQPRAIRFGADAMNLLQNTDWPGNIRQLRNLIDRVVVFTDASEISATELRHHLSPGQATDDASVDELVLSVLQHGTETNKLAWVEGLMIRQALALTNGNKSAAARLLGAHRKVIERRAV